MEFALKKQKLLISSCLLGELVKYNGSHNSFDETIIKKLKTKYELFAVCPEVDGGLPIPRVPCEIISFSPLKVLNKNGEDKTVEFVKGAQIALEICKRNSIQKALMKENSPSCSNSKVNDGSFSKVRVDGLGVCVELLEDHGIKVYNEKQIDKLIC